MATETLHEQVGSLQEPFHTLISAAILAPSGDNTQPWRFEVDEVASTITIYVDETRDTSPMNAGQRMSRIACGAAVENMLRTALHNNWAVEAQIHDSPIHVATLHILRFNEGAKLIDEAIVGRHTNRRLYSRGPVSNEVLTRLERFTNLGDDIRVSVIQDKSQIGKLAELIGKADEMLFQTPGVLMAFRENICFTSVNRCHEREGLPIRSLEIGFLDRLILRNIKLIPNWMLSSAPSRRRFRHKASRLVHNSAGLCILSAVDEHCRTDIIAGTVLQKIWLFLQEQRFAVQPMMSVPVLDSMCRFDAARHNSLAQALCRRVAAAAGLDSRRIVAVVRYGQAKPATRRTGRHDAAIALLSSPLK